LFCFVVYYLGHYPEVKQRLRQELEVVLGKDLTKPVTSKNLDELQYCDAVIKEVYRHCPVSFMNCRVNVEKDVIGGFSWSEGTSFQIIYSAIMKREDYWTDPEKFDPDRFYKIEESDKYLLEKQHVKNSFHMFGGGIRICPGRKLAMMKVKCLLSLIYRKYDIELVDMNAPLKCKQKHLTICEELIVKIKPRDF
jgi:cytochrome P450